MVRRQQRQAGSSGHFDHGGLTVTENAPLRGDRMAQRINHLSLAELAVGGGDQCFDRALATVGDGYFTHLGGWEYLPNAAFHRLGNCDSGNTAFVGIGSGDDTQVSVLHSDI